MLRWIFASLAAADPVPPGCGKEAVEGGGVVEGGGREGNDWSGR